jgi:hypothetical protein
MGCYRPEEREDEAEDGARGPKVTRWLSFSLSLLAETSHHVIELRLDRAGPLDLHLQTVPKLSDRRFQERQSVDYILSR